nr:hypothetical protein [Tanacetum cinerariifolium]
NLSAFDPKEDLAFLPEAIINPRTNSNGDLEVLVKWEKHNLEEATWENLNSLKLQFPDLDYIGDNVNSEGKGDDTANMASRLAHNIKQLGSKQDPPEKSRSP